MKKVLIITIICGLANLTFAQNFGIDDPSPAAKLTVRNGGQILGTIGAGSVNRTLTVLGDNTSQLNFGSYPYDWSPAIQIQNNDNTKFTWISAGGSGAYSANNARYYTSGSGLDFYTGSNAFAATIASNGNVGIGIGTPVTKLHVSGNVRISTLAGSGDRMVVANTNGDLSTQSIPTAVNFLGHLTNAATMVSNNTGFASFSAVQNTDASVFEVVTTGNFGVKIKKAGTIMWNYDQDIISTGSGYNYVYAAIDGSANAYSLVKPTGGLWDGLHIGGSYAVSANQVLTLFWNSSGSDITAMDNGVWGHLSIIWIGSN